MPSMISKRNLCNMKQGWEIKKLTDVCSIQYGCAFDSSMFSDSSEDGMPLIRIRDIKDGYSNTYYKGSYADDYVIHKGDYLIGMDGEFNIEPWKSKDALLNQRVCKIESKLKDVSIRFIYRFLKKELKRIEDETPFVTVKHLSAKRLNQVVLDIPSLDEQEKIVAELDCLSGIIEKKKQQLKEYDALAQSIFYEMFGNPIDNEKGWNKIRIGEFSTCIAGATPSTKVDDYWNNGNIPWLSSGEVGKGRIYETDKCITQTGYDSCSTRLIPPHTIVMAMAGQGKTRGTVGVVEISCCTNQSICSIVTNDTVDVDFLYYQLALLYQELRNISNGDGGRGGLNLKLIQNFRIIAPPLDMQKQFAKKILHIEKQKELIKQSIAETETLFNSRMDYYFN